jgi:hypothetical protein
VPCQPDIVIIDRPKGCSLDSQRFKQETAWMRRHLGGAGRHGGVPLGLVRTAGEARNRLVPLKEVLRRGFSFTARVPFSTRRNQRQQHHLPQRGKAQQPVVLAKGFVDWRQKLGGVPDTSAVQRVPCGSQRFQEAVVKIPVEGCGPSTVRLESENRGVPAQ